MIRSGGLDTRIRIYVPAALERQGRSRVPTGMQLVADLLADYEPAVGSERFASDQNIATAPAVFTIRRDADVAHLKPIGAVIALLENGDEVARFDVKSVRPSPRDPRRSLEIAAVSESVP